MSHATTRIELLGGLVAEIHGRRVELPGRQARLLFAYLAANRGRPVSRDELIDLLWPASPPADPAAGLRTILARLRGALGRDVLDGRDAVQLVLPRDGWVDVEAVEQMTLRAQEMLAAGDSARSLSAASRALELLDRPLLPSFSENWVEARRQELALARQLMLETRARAALALGGPDLVTAERDARSLIADAPFRESGHGLLMEILAARGDVAEALRVYGELRSILRAELGASPSPELVDLNRRLLLREHSAPDPGLPRPLALFADKPFVGRRPELRRLAKWWTAAGRSAPRIAVVRGEAGMGKTHLIASFARQLHAEGTAVLYGRCDREPAMPTQPFVEALDRWVAGGGVAPCGNAGAELREVATLKPGLGTPTAPPAPDAARTGLFFHAVVALLERIAAERRPLLVIDDLQWADEQTVQLLRHLICSLDPGRLTLVFGLGHDGCPERFRALLCELRGEAELEEIQLAGLRDGEAAELLDAHGADPAVARRVNRQAGGNPFLLEESALALAAARDVDRRRRLERRVSEPSLKPAAIRSGAAAGALPHVLAFSSTTIASAPL